STASGSSSGGSSALIPLTKKPRLSAGCNEHLAESRGFEYPQRDLNPRHGTENPGSWAARRWGPDPVLYSIRSKVSTIARASAAVTIGDPEVTLDTADRRFKMKWWGWGAEGVRVSLSQSPATLDYLRNRLGVERLEAPSTLRIESVRIPASRLDEAVRQK